MTHVGSNWELLKSALEKSSRIQVFNTGNSYHHPDDVRSLTKLSHKCNNSAAVWADVVMHNKDFTLKRLTEYYKLIFWSLPVGECLPELLKTYSYNQARNYYDLRLFGLKQYAGENSIWNPDLQSNTFLSSILG
jgi:hypothetical protein